LRKGVTGEGLSAPGAVGSGQTLARIPELANTRSGKWRSQIRTRKRVAGGWWLVDGGRGDGAFFHQPPTTSHPLPRWLAPLWAVARILLPVTPITPRVSHERHPSAPRPPPAARRPPRPGAVQERAADPDRAGRRRPRQQPRGAQLLRQQLPRPGQPPRHR